MDNHKTRSKRDIQDSFPARLELAQEKVQEIKSIKKLSEDDRKAFALGLGGLFEQVQNLVPSFSYAQLFDRAFDQRISESLQKKRKTLILQSNESTNSMGLTASPHKYLRLAETLDLVMREYADTKTGYAYVRMLENSSYDTRELSATRIEQEQQKALQEILTKCVEKVLNEVNLNQMHEWLDNRSLSTRGGTGKAIEIGDYPLNESLPASMTFFDMDMHNNGIAPCVRVKKLTKAVTPWIAFALDSRDFEPNCDGMIKRLDQYLTEKGLSEKLGIASFNDYPKKLKNESIDLFENSIIADNLLLDELPITIRINKFIDLEILFHTERKEWLPYLLERFESTCSTGYGGKTGKCESIDSDGYEIFFLGELFSEYECWLLCFKFRSNDDEEYFVYFIREDSHFELRFHDPVSIPMIPFEQNYIDCMYETKYRPEIWDHESFCIKQPEYSCVEQPQRTIAHAILSNLIYLDGDANLSQQLVKDAMEKYQLLSKYIKQSKKEYEDRFKAFMNS